MYSEDLVAIFGKRQWKSRTEEIMQLQAERDAKRLAENGGTASDADGNHIENKNQNKDVEDVEATPADASSQSPSQPTPPPFVPKDNGDAPKA